MLPLVALALQFLPLLTKVPEVVGALKGGRALEAAEKVVDIAKTVSGAIDPAAAVAAVNADPALQAKLQEALIAERVRFAELALEETKVYVADTSDARHVNAGDRGVYWLGVIILMTFAVLVGFGMYGAYQI